MQKSAKSGGAVTSVLLPPGVIQTHGDRPTLRADFAGPIVPVRRTRRAVPVTVDSRASRAPVIAARTEDHQDVGSVASLARPWLSVPRRRRASLTGHLLPQPTPIRVVSNGNGADGGADSDDEEVAFALDGDGSYCRFCDHRRQLTGFRLSQPGIALVRHRPKVTLGCR